MRRFYLERHKDATGISGTGFVAEGVEFGNKKCFMRWLTKPSSFCYYESADDLISIHGHGGMTEIVFVDEEKLVAER